MNNNDDTPCYPFLVGQFEAFLKHIPYMRIPGVEVTDREKFEQFILEHIKSCREEAVKYNKGI